MEYFYYYPVAHWVWGKGGWLGTLGVYDFAGGIVVHINAGMGSLAAAFDHRQKKKFWAGHTSSSQYSISSNRCITPVDGVVWIQCRQCIDCWRISGQYFISNSTASATSSLVWILLSWKRSGKPSVVAAINGAIAGLAGVTPASGYISVQNSLILGIVLGLVSYFAITLLKERLRIDDALDVSSVHGITGIVGTLAVGLIARA